MYHCSKYIVGFVWMKKVEVDGMVLRIWAMARDHRSKEPKSKFPSS